MAIQCNCQLSQTHAEKISKSATAIALSHPAQRPLSVSAHSDSPFTYVWTWDTYARSVQDGIPGADSETFTFKVERTGVLHCTVIDKEDPSL